MPQLSVLLTCKNERKNIEACVRSFRSIADEVLIADSGSTDGTLELAHQLGDRVIEREYGTSGDFKNWAIPQCAYDWVLIIDADERVTPNLATEIRAVLDGGSRKASDEKRAFSIRRRNFFLGHPIDHGDWAQDKVVRLIRRDCRYATYTDHAEIDVHGNELGLLRHKLVHYTAWDFEAYLQRMTHYAAQQAVMWHSQGKKPRLLKLWLNGPSRFLRGYLFKAGFLDGSIGFTVASMTAYYSFLKQSMLWDLVHGIPQNELERHYAAERLPMSDAA